MVSHTGLSRTGVNWHSAIVVLSLLVSPVLAEPATQNLTGSGERLSIESLARQVQSITDVVLAQHVNPPTRQEMWLAGTKALLAKAGIVHYAGLSAEISRLTTAEQLASFLTELCAKEGISRNHQAALAQQQAFTEGMLGIIDGGATFISPKELIVHEQFQGNRYIGTGIALNYNMEKKYPQIAAVIPGGPMERAGGRKLDLILKIDDRDAHALNIVDTIDLLRGPEGTSVTLVVGPTADERRTIVVTRGPVVLATLEGLRQSEDGKWDYRIEPYLPICCVKVAQINGSTVHDLRKLERQFRAEGVQAVVLDLRRSFAQDLHHTLLLADALMDGGVIGRVRTGSNVREYRADRECLFRDWPLAVLVDQNTRGGGEWIAAALQDNHAAVIVGEQTAGVAHIRSLAELPGDGGAVQMNTAIFERPSGLPLEKVMDSTSNQPRPRRIGGDADRPSGGMIPDLPKSREPAPGLERLVGALRQQAPGGPQGTRSLEEDSDGEVRRRRMPRGPQVAQVDDASILRIAVLELRARLDAREGKSRQ
jgi:carboxyl-terminal processing protease